MAPFGSNIAALYGHRYRFQHSRNWLHRSSLTTASGCRKTPPSHRLSLSTDCT
ncbi:uncharacterized protein K452DRAFT_292128 [Aplosporella prunicola CBS 121167]|uniref:Uncharacterized protein n=1 Tax=Aplosporella prunicola CBS 121167 TaxID=1176127 RepID=A0A6A6B1A6_9PEZI|nr:uncharacterized protein K452DRAFT_292664 [Aplosporella prunicola CBS 121167]XP_033392525.1 uncharacterized protein K452DRAFT_292128 [Aplosporella prunicola CBS 121167]KAF2136119.1 hypothetical protein K452DRAFT_292664 [Aplosporella prunicola CBS 121167]KAF2136807.1 hypothetical protein K452DRAFT_292128 [Aplosporella prunicola CBS 121167]